jgi:hypothetical protein
LLENIFAAPKSAPARYPSVDLTQFNINKIRGA